MESRRESYCEKPQIPDDHIKVIVPDANIWIKYFGGEIGDDMKLDHKGLKEYIDSKIDSKKLQVTKKIKDESNAVFKWELSRLDDDGKLNDGKAYYTNKLNKLFKKIHVEKNVGDRNTDFGLVKDMYDRIWRDTSEKYMRKKMRWGKIKYEAKRKKKKSLPAWDDLEHNQKRKFIHENRPPTHEDQIILSTVSYMRRKDKTGRNFALLSADSDFWIFADDICDEFNVKVLDVKRFMIN